MGKRRGASGQPKPKLEIGRQEVGMAGVHLPEDGEEPAARLALAAGKGRRPVTVHRRRHALRRDPRPQRFPHSELRQGGRGHLGQRQIQAFELHIASRATMGSASTPMSSIC